MISDGPAADPSRARASSSASVEASTTRTGSVPSWSRVPWVLPVMMAASWLTSRGVTGSVPAAVWATGMPSTSTEPPTTVRRWAGKAGQTTAVASGWSCRQACSAPVSCPGIEPRTVESILR